MEPFLREPEYLSHLQDGTVKQLNPFTGTEVWTIPGRGNRPLGVTSRTPHRLEPGEERSRCAFCSDRYLETPPEKTRVIRGAGGWETVENVPANELHATLAEFRRVPNLFEILSYDYWKLNYGYQLPEQVARAKEAYLAEPDGLAHVLSVVAAKLRAGGKSDDQIARLSVEERLALASGFFGGGHDVVIARRHFVEGATNDSQLASSGTLSREEHEQFIRLTIEAVRQQYQFNRYARYVTVFQNWLAPAGASFDHLHKQLVAIDERGSQQELTLAKLRRNNNIFNEAGANYAARKNLYIAESEHAIAFAGFGHRYPTIEIFSRSAQPDPWRMSDEEIAGMSDMIHAIHAATGPEIPCNEEWHYRPIDVREPMPWRVMLKWRVSTVAGFEGASKIYLNTIAPETLRDRVTAQLFALRTIGHISGQIRVGMECEAKVNPLRYVR
ncbi:DUF4921 family protein [Tessaracoccus sp. OH4464_COT-324]|uniref:DUF4921 family protein n=1 Tax=Tessaracoccus sp. OH4464_COT-324 TaxID=2491059 RepID=UPI000F63571C|nr:DUF4921 family protein [Tessaracoccus sp. OH4464_COT-324]RRD47711.1 DUF4921 family protein [Tessaracoccus sp. OH4464_COT-324]